MDTPSFAPGARRGPTPPAWLRLLRPPNLVTAAADVVAGFAVAGLPDWGRLALLAPAGVLLYAGGVALNDVCDAELDAVERPERPIPSGRITRRRAAALAFGCLAAGVALALAASPTSGMVAAALAACIVLYDAWAKGRPVAGPAVMASCRGLNLLLGLSASPILLQQRWAVAVVPTLYIAAVTVVSLGEVQGARRTPAVAALALLGASIAGLPCLASALGGSALWSGLFAMLPLGLVAPAYLRCAGSPSPALAGAAVRAGVLSLIALDAAIAAGFGGVYIGAAILAAAPPARALARVFSVT